MPDCGGWSDVELVFPDSKSDALTWIAIGGRYGQAVGRWWNSDRQKRSLSEVNKIIVEHCVKCKWFRQDVRSCKRTGCRIGKCQRAFINYVTMKTNVCPVLPRRW